MTWCVVNIQDTWWYLWISNFFCCRHSSDVLFQVEMMGWNCMKSPCLSTSEMINVMYSQSTMISPHLRINCADPTEDSCPGRITVCVLVSSRTRLSKLSYHCTGTVTVTFPQTNTTATRARTMDQSYPLIHPGSKRSTRSQNPQSPFIFFFILSA